MKRIYLDYNASTPIAPEVAAAMQAFLTEHFGNPSSLHWAGAPAKAAVEQARAQVARRLGCSSGEKSEPGCRTLVILRSEATKNLPR